MSSPGTLSQSLASDRPFGDTSYIRAQMEGAFRRRLIRISDRLETANALLEALANANETVVYRTLGDPIVRSVVQQALTQITLGQNDSRALEQCAQVLDKAAHHATSNSDVGPLVAATPNCTRVGPAPFHGWLWSNEEAGDGVLNEAFWFLIRRERYDPLSSPDQASIDGLRRAVELLGKIAPELASSTLGHTHLIALFPRTGRRQQVISSSQFRIVGVIFLAQELLDNPWVAAEHILHESLHQKIYDLRHAHSVLRCDVEPESDQEGSAQIESLWNRHDGNGSNCWGPSRSLAALHVYTHLAVYAAMVEAAATSGQGPPGSTDTRLIRSDSAWRRARYLADQLQATYSQALGRAGTCLVDWSRQCLDLISSSPSEAALRASLLLERYDKEIRSIDTYIDRSCGQSPESDISLCQLIDIEMMSTQRLLKLCDQSAMLDEFCHKLIPYLSADRTLDKVEYSAAVRRIIRHILERTLTDTAANYSRQTVCEIIDTMVQSGSSELVKILADV